MNHIYQSTPTIHPPKREPLEIITKQAINQPLKIRLKKSKDEDYDPETPVSPNFIKPPPATTLDEKQAQKNNRVCAYCHTRITPMWRHGKLNNNLFTKRSTKS